jgi:hypothetical protein
VTFRLPVVTSADKPLYPPTGLVAKVSGTVKIRLTTDGAQISALHIDEGPPLLAEAASDNLRTWRFAKHTPTTFVVTFEYQLVEQSQCGLDKATVEMDLPVHVRVAAHAVGSCDPTTAFRASTPRPNGCPC